jgi:hypothetical protein
VDPNAPKVTRNVTVTESNHCPICGRGVTAGTSNRCTECGTSELCGSCCVLKWWDKALCCRKCLATNNFDCLICGNISLKQCDICIKLHEKDPSHVIQRYCLNHFVDNFYKKGSMGHISIWHCTNCGNFICEGCAVGGIWKKCKNCNSRLKRENTTYNDMVTAFKKTDV